ncbi:MAG TPA: fumarylacetoacetate hydrolase family protein [Terracidiphilus sp.]|nr:fumarylacetoacetate hydrolase family protein [Terracidiphilus sp.]
MKLYCTAAGCVVEEDNQYYRLEGISIDFLLSRNDLPEYLAEAITQLQASAESRPTEILAPISHQEVWAAGVTYFRSRGARMEESKDAGGGDFYDRVYSAERPELFFKSTASRTVGTGGQVRIRSDAHWSVPEPELTLVISPNGRIVGYTIGNDMSSRDIEGENPLYLPQAKVYQGSCSLGPCILIGENALPHSTEIALEIDRNNRVEFADSVSLTQLKRTPKGLVDYLMRDNLFPSGCFLMTGTGIVPPNSFTLASGDRIRITIEPIGTLENEVG